MLSTLFLAPIAVKILFLFSLKRKRLQRIAGLAPKSINQSGSFMIFSRYFLPVNKTNFSL